MKLKKIIASLTAAAMAVTTMAFAPLSVSADAVKAAPTGKETVIAKIENYTASYSGANWDALGCPNSDWNVDISSYMTDPDAYVKLVASVTSTYDIAAFQDWACAAKWYTDDYTVEFKATSDSTMDNYVSYVPLSDFRLTMSNGSSHSSSMQANLQLAFATAIDIKSFDIGKVVSQSAVVPTSDVELGTLSGGGEQTTEVASWDPNSLDKNTWSSDFYPAASKAASAAYYSDTADYLKNFAGILYEVNVSSVETVKYGDLNVQPYGSCANYNWISGEYSTAIENGTDNFYVYMDIAQLLDGVASTTTLAQMGVQLYDKVNFAKAGLTGNVSYTAKATLLLNKPTLSIISAPDLTVGDTAAVDVEIIPDVLASTLKWESDNKTVAEVDKDGKVTGVSAGKAKITVTSPIEKSLKDFCTVTVEKGTIPVTKVTVTPETATLKVGKTTDLKAEVLPADATDKTVTWTSSDDTVATVDKNGKVTAKAAGTATIKAVSNADDTIYGSCEVTVEKNTYAITVKSNNDAYGTASAGVDEAAEGDVVGLTYTAAKGYKFSKWESEDVTVAEDNTFTMPAKAVTVTAVFEELPPDEFAINVAKTVNGKVSVKGGVTSSVKDTVIEVVITPDKGYEVDTVKVNGEAITGTSFTMPANDVTIEVTFKKISYTVTVKAGENGKASVDKATAQMGDTVTVTATPDANYELAQIVVNGKTITGNTFVMPAENVTVEVTFNRYLYTVTVTAAENGKVTVDKTSAKVGETVTVTATPDADYELSKITVNGTAITGSTFTMPAENVTVAAEFKKVGSADAEIVAPEGVSVSFAGSKEDILKAVFGDDYADLVAAGYKLDVVMTVKDETAVSADDKALVKGALSSDMHVALLVDVSLVMTKDGVSTVVANSSKPVSFVIGVPDSAIADGRTYSVIRVHNGAAENIGGTYDAANKTITVSSDKYSTYAVVYKDAPAPEPTVNYYSIKADNNVTLTAASAAAGAQINIRVNFGYDAYVYCGGRVIDKITESGSFTMPAGNVTIVTKANGYLVMVKNAAPNSYIFVYDADMNYIKTNGSVKGIKGEGKITVKLGEEYAGKTVTLYKGRKSTSVKLDSLTLDENGNATFTVEGGKNYTAVVE